MTKPVSGSNKRAIPKSRASQLLSRLLENSSGEWVPAPELARIGGLQLNARLWELRHKLKVDVENKVEVIKGEKHSWYRLRRGAPIPSQEKPSEQQSAATSTLESLFGDLRPDRTYVE